MRPATPHLTVLRPPRSPRASRRRVAVGLQIASATTGFRVLRSPTRSTVHRLWQKGRRASIAALRRSRGKKSRDSSYAIGYAFLEGSEPAPRRRSAPAPLVSLCEPGGGRAPRPPGRYSAGGSSTPALTVEERSRRTPGALCAFSWAQTTSVPRVRRKSVDDRLPGNGKLLGPPARRWSRLVSSRPFTSRSRAAS